MLLWVDSNKTISEKVFTINDVHPRLHAGHVSCWLSGGQKWWSVPESETQRRLYTSMTARASLKSTPAPLAAPLVCTGPVPRHISWPQIFIWGWRRTKLGLFWCSFAVVWARKSRLRAGKTWIRMRKSGVKLVGRQSSLYHRRTGLSAGVWRADWRGRGGETEEREQPYQTCNVIRHRCWGRSRQTPPSTGRSEVGVASIKTRWLIAVAQSGSAAPWSTDSSSSRSVVVQQERRPIFFY